MIGALVFYFSCSIRNRFAARLKRLRQPKYLISILAGIGYLVLVFHRQLMGLPGNRPAASLDPALLPVLETAFALLLFAVVLFPWVWPGKGEGIHFTEAEVQFLFPAPLSRRTLLHFRMVKGQLGILLGVLISVFLLGRGRLFSHPLHLIITLWVVYTFLGLYRLGTSLVKGNPQEGGALGRRYRFWFLGAAGGFVVAAVMWLRWSGPSMTQLEEASPLQALGWLASISQTGPAGCLLAPFRGLVRPAFAADWMAFLRSMIPAIGMMIMAYLWVIHSDVSFEEASLARARKVAAMLDAVRRGGPQAPLPARARRPLFRLNDVGPQYIALFWKNLISAGRFSPRALIPIVVVIGVIAAVSLGDRGSVMRSLPAVVGSVAAIMLIFLTLMGPIIVRGDLRTDLLYVVQLKTYPIPGWSLVLGEVLAPVAILAAAQWLLLLVAAFFLPSIGETALKVQQRIAFGSGLALLLPLLTGMGVLVQNAAALILPGWVQLGRQHQRGIEAMGQRLIVTAGTMLVLVLAALPAGVLFTLAFLSGYWLLGIAIIPAAALIAALGLLLEAGFIIAFLGRLYDRFDAALELDSI